MKIVRIEAFGRTPIGDGQGKSRSFGITAELDSTELNDLPAAMRDLQDKIDDELLKWQDRLTRPMV